MGKESNGVVVPYSVQSSEELGRYVVAVRDFQVGETVLTERPLVFAPKTMSDPEAVMPCVGCYTPVLTEAGERCAKCGWPVCSGNCPGLTDPKHHGIECNILSARPECVLDNMPEYYRHDALLPLRCILLQTTDPDKWTKLLDMQSHMECRGLGTEAYEEANELVVEYLLNSFINKLSEDLKNKYLPDVSIELLQTICGIIETNALEIRLPQGAELYALYTNTCKLEHSCIPNTKHTFNLFAKDKSDLYNITIKTVVPVMTGDHITTMYSHALWGTQARRQHLRDTKYFSCKCLRCSDPTELGTYLSAMKCLGDGTKPCEGMHLPIDPLNGRTVWSCSECKVTVYNSEINLIISQMGEEVENVLMMGESVTVLENLLCRLSTFLHTNHYHLYTIKHSLIQLYGRHPGYTSQNIIDRKIRMCQELLDVTNKLDPGNARLSLYSSVLYHELHLALVQTFKTKNNETTLNVIETRPLLAEAKKAVDSALNCLKDDTDETAGKRLYSVIEESKKKFEQYCNEHKLIP